MTIVRMEHFRQTLSCARGVREGFVRYGFSRDEYAAFLRDGIEAGTLLQRTGEDDMVRRVVEVAREQQ